MTAEQTVCTGPQPASQQMNWPTAAFYQHLTKGQLVMVWVPDTELYYLSYRLVTRP